MLEKIKYIAAYQTKPVKAVTYYAPVKEIEPYGEDGKYKLVFSEKAKQLEPAIPLGDANAAWMKAPQIHASREALYCKEADGPVRSRITAGSLGPSLSNHFRGVTQ